MSNVLDRPPVSSHNARSASESPAFEISRVDDIEIHPHDRFIQIVESLVSATPCLHWLDIGCGWHFDWRWEEDREKSLLRKAHVTGIDPDWQAISRHRSIGRRVVGIVERLPFQDESFDLVTANVVVEHLKHPALAFAEIQRVLSPGGVFVFRTPSARSHFVRIARRLPQWLKTRLAAGVLEDRQPEDVYPALYLANTSEDVGELCRLTGFRNTHVTVTRARGVLTKLPKLAYIERQMAAAFGFTEGNLIVQARK